MLTTYDEEHMDKHECDEEHMDKYECKECGSEDNPPHFDDSEFDGDLAKELGNSIKIPDVPQPLPERCKHHPTTVSSPGRWPSDFKAFSSVGDTGIEPVTSCVSCKRANQLRQSPNMS